MERASFAKMECPIARAVDEIGEAWTLLVLREAFKGARTFSDFEAQLPIAPTTLTRRLEALVARGFFSLAEYQSNPPRYRYEPTEKALELLPVLVAVGAWGNRWLAPEGDIFTIIDPETGDAMDVAVVDRKTGRPLRPGRVGLGAGRGARKRTHELLRTPLVLGKLTRA